MAYETNRFCWHGLISTDLDAAKAFYPEALGWKTVEMDMGGENSTMFVANDVPVAHLMAPPMEGMPSHWSNYLRVDDVDASTKKAVANGGTEIAPPSDIAPGRFSAVASPSGAVIHLFHEADEATATHHPGGTGGVHWTELHSGDIGADVQWLTATFDFTTSEIPMPNGTYTMLHSGEHPKGGALPKMTDQAPSMWLSWFQVDDCDAAVARVKQHGGNALSEPMDMHTVGRMAIVSDPTGGVFGIIKPAPRT